MQKFHITYIQLSQLENGISRPFCKGLNIEAVSMSKAALNFEELHPTDELICIVKK